MQYIATNNNNLLTNKEDMFTWNGVGFRGLVDESENSLYDHPEDSYMNFIGMKNSVESGHVMVVTTETVATWGQIKKNLGNLVKGLSPPTIKWFPPKPLVEGVIHHGGTR